MTQPSKYGIIDQDSPFKIWEVTMIKYFLFFGRVRINLLEEALTHKFQYTIFDSKIYVLASFYDYLYTLEN